MNKAFCKFSLAVISQTQHCHSHWSTSHLGNNTVNKFIVIVDKKLCEFSFTCCFVHIVSARVVVKFFIFLYSCSDKNLHKILGSTVLIT